MTDDRRRELESQLSAYLDDELGPQERHDVEALLAEDERARELLEQLRAGVEAVRSLPRARASDRLVESLRARMERQSLLGSKGTPARARSSERSYIRWIAAAAVIALTATSGYLMWPLAQEQLGRTRQKYALVNPPAKAPAGGPAEYYGDDKAKRGRSVAPPAAPAAPAVTEQAASRHETAEDVSGAEGEQFKAGEATQADRLAGVRTREHREKAAEVANPPETGFQAQAKGEEIKQAKGKESAGGAPVTEGPAILADGEGLEGALGRSKAEGKDVGGNETHEALGLAGINTNAVSTGTTVVELAFADSRDRQEAVQRLREEYAFQPVALAARAGDAIESLEVRVPDLESARRVVHSLQESMNTAEEMRVVTASLPESSKKDLGARSFSSRVDVGIEETPAAMPLAPATTKPQAPPTDVPQEPAFGQPAAPVAPAEIPNRPFPTARTGQNEEMSRPMGRAVRANQPAASKVAATQPTSDFSMTTRAGRDSMGKQVGARTGRPDRLRGGGMSRPAEGRVREEFGGFGGMAGGPQPGSAPARSVGGPGHPPQPLQSTVDAVEAKPATRPAIRAGLESEAFGRRQPASQPLSDGDDVYRLTIRGAGSEAPPQILRLFVRVEPPASHPAAATHPATQE